MICVDVKPQFQVYEFESSKRNNLIFYGLASEDGEVATNLKQFRKNSRSGLQPSRGPSEDDTEAAA